MATWENRWDGNILFSKTSGTLTVEEARLTIRALKAAIDEAPAGKWAMIVDLSDYPTQAPEVVDATLEEHAALGMESYEQVCLALVIAKTTTKMQLSRQTGSVDGQTVIYCDDMEEARAAVEQVLVEVAA